MQQVACAQVWVQVLIGGDKAGHVAKVRVEQGGDVDDLCEALLVKFPHKLRDFDSVDLTASRSIDPAEKGAWLRPGATDVLPGTTDESPIFIHVLPPREKPTGAPTNNLFSASPNVLPTGDCTHPPLLPTSAAPLLPASATPPLFAVSLGGSSRASLSHREHGFIFEQYLLLNIPMSNARVVNNEGHPSYFEKPYCCCGVAGDNIHQVMVFLE
jgi:hypothetical protein